MLWVGLGNCQRIDKMNIKIKLHPNSSQEKIEKKAEDKYEVWLKEKPINNKANEKLIKVLKKFFGTQRRTPREKFSLQGAKQVKIKSGFTSRNKVIEVGE